MDELKIQKKLRKFAKDRNWEQFHSLKNLAISINLESSELLEIFQWENEVFEGHLGRCLDKICVCCQKL